MVRDIRHLIRLRVQLKGVDASGRPFRQTVFTHDVSQCGARLEDTPPLVEPASVVEVQHRGRKGRYRVVWIGDPATLQHSHVGLQSLDPSQCLWGRPLPGRPIYSTPPASN